MQSFFSLAVILLLTILLFGQCVSKRIQTEKEIQELLRPVPSSFSSADSAMLVAQWSLGIRLFKSNCDGCHGIFGTTAKVTMVDFDREQLQRYRESFLEGDHENHAVMSKMTEEELESVFRFLEYMKRK